jgi:hypothetical protein
MDTLLNLQLAAHRTQSVSGRLAEFFGVGPEISTARGIDEGLATVA